MINLTEKYLNFSYSSIKSPTKFFKTLDKIKYFLYFCENFKFYFRCLT